MSVRGVPKSYKVDSVVKIIIVSEEFDDKPIQANLLNRDTSINIALVDILPISLGIETKGGFMTKIIDKNISIPCSKSKIFSTHFDNQINIEIKKKYEIYINRKCNRHSISFGSR